MKTTFGYFEKQATDTCYNCAVRRYVLAHYCVVYDQESNVTEEDSEINVDRVKVVHNEGNLLLE
jgi:hypothetical protein